MLRNQFTEVTGPAGIYGSEDPANDPIWSIGWDHKSLILMLLDKGEWHRFRLPKASHSYDGAHGWNTEWPRIRDIGEEDLLMTMHGMMWRFPRTFSAANTAGITPRSTYLKVIGDFCRWQNRVVFGCDDTARSEFQNKRKAKGEIAAPRSQSNLWFVEPEQLDHLGPVFARGALWLNEEVQAGQVSDPMLVHGFDSQSMHLVTDKPSKIYIEADLTGRGDWRVVDILKADGYQWHNLALSPTVQWVRLRSKEKLDRATAWFQLQERRSDLFPILSFYDKPAPPPEAFLGMPLVLDREAVGGVIRARGEKEGTLHFAARVAFAAKLPPSAIYFTSAEFFMNYPPKMPAAFPRSSRSAPTTCRSVISVATEACSSCRASAWSGQAKPIARTSFSATTAKPRSGWAQSMTYGSLGNHVAKWGSSPLGE